ncbi:ATP-binding protein [Treponema sp.]|uniref:ATP-binding protein n=1 Tax=Treponema sp. TaxID=166 RepID=UPI0025799EDA|nr:ATP-binding protein [Treponema sp.]MBE6354744.1 ATP-binding protein [Treponema sp.]
MKLKNFKITNFFSKGKKQTDIEPINKKKVIKNKDLPSYIGFSSLKREYRRLIEPGRTIKCLIGFPKTGKTRFINETFKNLPDNCVFLSVSLSECTTYRHMWEKIINQVKNQVRIQNEEVLNSLNFILSISDDVKLPTEPFQAAIESIFVYLTESNKKIILVLDQFEYARKLFENNVAYYALLKQISSDNESIDCSLVLITKAHLKSVLRETDAPSPFEDRFTENTNYITGFSEDDLEYFFHSISSTQKLSSKQIDEILYYTGNNPELLKEFKRILQKYRQSRKNFDNLEIKELITPELRLKISNIYEKFYKYICGYYYEDINSQKGKTEYLSRLVPYIYNFSRSSVDEQSLIDLGLLRKDENGYYYCISHGFTQYILREHNSELDSYNHLAALDNNLYKLFMTEFENLISDFKAFGTTVLDIEKAIILKSVVNYEWNQIEKYYNENSTSIYQELPDYFKILSIKGKLKFLKDKWNIFGKYFLDNDEWKVSSNWDKNFGNILKDERDGVSHFNIPFMKSDLLLKINECCKQICEIINSKVKDMPKKKNESEYIMLATRFKSNEVDDTKIGEIEDPNERCKGKIIRETYIDADGKNRESIKIESEGFKYKFQSRNAVDRDGNIVIANQLTDGLIAEFDIQDSATSFKAGFAINVVIDI